MIGSKAFVVVGSVLTILGASSAAASDHDHRDGRNYVVPCSLDGVNPVYHREIFGNPAAAAAYGFVRARDGSWRLAPDCRRW